MPNEIKSELRKKLLARRRALSLRARENESRVIAQKFLRSRFYARAHVIGFYASTSEEVATDTLIEHALKSGKRVVLPRVEIQSAVSEDQMLNTKYQILTWREIKSLAELELGAFGIREPKKSCRKIDLKSLDLLVVPGVAFDASRNRLGYGKGFYDRVLAEFRGASIGLAFSRQLVKKIPVDEWDRKVDRVISN